MTKIEATTVSEIEGVNVSDDGQHALLKLRLISGSNIILAFPSDMLVPLMQCISHASGKVQKNQFSQPDMKHVLSPEWWEIGAHEDQVVLSFRMPGGMELSFQIHRDAAARFRETLGSVLGDESLIPDNHMPRH